jgi:hypothetical protein
MSEPVHTSSTDDVFQNRSSIIRSQMFFSECDSFSSDMNYGRDSEDIGSSDETQMSIQTIFDNIPLFDPIALRTYLSTIDVSRYGFRSGWTGNLNSVKQPEQAISVFPSSPSNLYSSSDLEDDFGPFSPRFLSRSPTKRELVTSYRSRRQPGSKSPYKGRHGTNPRCASCKTTKTPYWRDSWNQGFILCNACGLRYSKFKRRCGGCNYVPRKEDKTSRQCSQCTGDWA